MTTFPTDFINGNTYVEVDVIGHTYFLTDKPLSKLTPEITFEIIRKSEIALDKHAQQYGVRPELCRAQLLKIHEGAYNYFVENAPNKHEWNRYMFHEVCVLGYKIALQILLKRKLIEVPMMSFLQVVKDGRKDLVELFIEAGMDLDSIDNYADTALHQAVQGNFREITELLMNSGAEINKGNMYGFSPFHYAKHPDMIELLIRAGADIESQGNLGARPIVSKDKSKVERLISLGARVDHTNKFGVSALYYAAKDNREDIAAILLNAGAL